MSIKVKRVGKGLNAIVDQLSKLQGQSIEVGHFKEQGLHKSGFSFPELMAFHHNGGTPTGDAYVVPRPLLDLFFEKHRHSMFNDRVIKAAFTRWKKRTPSEESNKKLLADIGRRIAKLEKDAFGDPSLLPVTNNPTPLVDTGELRNAVAFRTSLDKRIRKR